MPLVSDFRPQTQAAAAASAVAATSYRRPAAMVGQPVAPAQQQPQQEQPAAQVKW